jgi:hypothetical protein
MHTRVSLTLAVSAALALAASGCTTSPTIARGQNPASDPWVTPTSYGTQPHLHEAVADQIHGNTISHYNVPTQGMWISASEAACPPSHDCPHCKGSPPAGQACPVCQSQEEGHHHHLFTQGLMEDYPEHHFTYAYKRPKNLQYPPPQVPGGIVVYPYYTLKGPSDFFRE